MESNLIFYSQIPFSKSVFRRTLQWGFVTQDKLERPPYSPKRYWHPKLLYLLFFNFITFWFFFLLALFQSPSRIRFFFFYLIKTMSIKFFTSDKVDPFVLEIKHQKTHRPTKIPSQVSVLSPLGQLLVV